MYIDTIFTYLQISFNSIAGYGWPRIGLVHSGSGEKEDFEMGASTVTIEKIVLIQVCDLFSSFTTERDSRVK